MTGVRTPPPERASPSSRSSFAAVSASSGGAAGVGLSCVHSCSTASRSCAGGPEKAHLFIFNDDLGGNGTSTAIGWAPCPDIGVGSGTAEPGESDPARE